MSGDQDGPSYELGDARQAIDEMVRWMQAGADVVISRDGKPVARLIPYEQDPGDQGDTEINLRLR